MLTKELKFFLQKNEFFLKLFGIKIDIYSRLTNSNFHQNSFITKQRIILI
jgi:hypothetical protein